MNISKRFAFIISHRFKKCSLISEINRFFIIHIIRVLFLSLGV